MEDPLPLLPTIGANLGTYFTELTNGQAALIPGQIENNIQTFFKAPWWNGRTRRSSTTTRSPTNYISNTTTRHAPSLGR